MKNKILITAIASTILASTSAHAVDYALSYNGNDNFSFDGKRFNNFVRVKRYIIENKINFNPKVDNIIIDAQQQKNLINDILNNPGIRNGFIRVLLNDDPIKMQHAINILNQFNEALSALPAEDKNKVLASIDINQLNHNQEQFVNNIISLIDKKPGFTILAGDENGNVTIKSSRNENIDQIIQRIKNLQNHYVNRSIRLGSDNELTEIVNKSNFDQKLKNNLLEMNELTMLKVQGVELTPEQQSHIAKVYGELINHPEYTTIRNSVEVQERLKMAQKYLEGENSTIDENIKNNILSTTIETLSLYLVSDVKDINKVPEVQKSDSAISLGLVNSVIAARGQVDARINNAGIAAGDFMNTKGVWLEGSYTNGNQKAYGNTPGYKLSQKGLTIGVDAGDEAVLGLAYSIYMNDIKNKNNSKNKEDLISHIATIYGKFDISNQVFLKGQGQFGKSYIKKERNTGDRAKNIAKAKTKATISSAKIEMGYDAAIYEKFHLIPSVGLSYVNVDIKGYKESGRGLNRSVGKRTSNRTSGLAGLSAAYILDIGSNTKLLPEVHANLDYALASKNSGTNVTVITGIDPIATPSEKIAKAYYNIGASLKSVYNDNFEASIGYDLGLAKKFHSHTGALKLRVNM